MWVTLIMTLLSFFTAKKNGASTSQALLGAAVVGAGTYYATTQTDWGKSTLGALDSKIDGWVNPTTGAQTVDPKAVRPILDSEGNQVYGKNGEQLYELISSPAVKGPNGNFANSLVQGTAGVLSSWGGAGTAAVIGTTAVATSSNFEKYLPYLLLGGAVLLLMR